MYEYSHGGNAAFEAGGASVIDLSANINPLGMPEGVRDAIIRDIAHCTRYPDNFSLLLRQKTAEFEKVNPNWIFFGNGASDIIFRLPRAVQAKKIMLTAPTFSDYERSGRSYGAEIVHYVLSPCNGFALNGGFIDAVLREKPGLVYLCNPNNPTGVLTDRKIIHELLDACRRLGAWLAVDECFLDFAEQAGDYTSKIFLEKYANLIILKAFTKFFALPGIRLGYALCADGALIDRLYFHGADWAVSNLAQAAGIAALEGAEGFARRTVLFVAEERVMMEKELTRLGYRVFASGANYVFFHSPYPFDLREELDKKGIRIRSCANYHGLDKAYYRIAVSTKENNRKLLAEMGDITGL